MDWQCPEDDGVVMFERPQCPYKRGIARCRVVASEHVPAIIGSSICSGASIRIRFDMGTTEWRGNDFCKVIRRVVKIDMDAHV